MRNLVLTTIIILCQISAGFGQQVWPGDINNNGVVNNIDVLYWAVANGATGGSRQDPSSTWGAQNLPAVLWGQNFPNGLNFAYADCDGDGDVDDADKTVIENNYGQVHGTVVPDEYAMGDPASDPVLQLSTQTPVIAPEATLLADLALGSQTAGITDFYGIAFTVTYDPAVVGTQGNDFLLNLPDDSWMSGQGDDKVVQFVKHDRNNGIAEYAIVRKNGMPVSGFGKIGTFSIVMEDIIVGLSRVSTSNIQMVNLELDRGVVANSDLEFSVDSTLTTTVRPIVNRGIKLYPNPVTGQEINLELEDPAEQIRFVQLFDVAGRLLHEERFAEGVSRQRFRLDPYTKGIYTFKVYTDKRLYVRSFFR